MRYCIPFRNGSERFFLNKSELISFLRSRSYVLSVMFHTAPCIHRVSRDNDGRLRSSFIYCSLKDFVVKHKLM